ncbi:MAG: helix-turn-helix domain-containing protein [Spirochaetota bacterium]|nr:helix-turn-helix domain-containing protein [Spirochaetota bacterium]
MAATNKNLKKMVLEGRFRGDLYHRLNVFNVSIPPIRERKDDILPLVFHFLDKLAERDDVNHYEIKIRVLKSLMQYDWPGNVREIENSLLGAVSYLPAGQTIIDSIPENIPRTSRYQQGKVIRKTYAAGEKNKSRVLLKPLWEVRKDAVITTLRACGGNRQEAAEILEISRNTLYRIIEKYEITEKDYLR